MTPEQITIVLAKILCEIDGASLKDGPLELLEEDRTYVKQVAEIARRLASVPCFATNELSEFRRIKHDVAGQTLDNDETDVIGLWICRRFNQETSN